MDELQLTIRRNKRGCDTQLSLSKKMISIIPSQIFQLSHLEVLDLSHNKISNLDPKLNCLKKLKMLILNDNNISSLDSFIQKMDLEILNLSNNPLIPQFQSLLDMENQSQPRLQYILEECFMTVVEKPEWLDEYDKSFDIQPKWFEPTKSVHNKKQDLEYLLKDEQQKVLDLKHQLELVKQQPKDNIKQNNDQLEFNDIQIIKNINQGQVFQGNLKGTLVAVKKVLDSNLFQNEIQMLQQIKHPNVVLMMASIQKPPSIIIEYICNGNLFDFLHQSHKDISYQQKKYISIQIAQVMNYLHQSKICFRDLKSQNILIDDNLKIKLCDFAQAKKFNEINKEQFQGMPMCPELIQKKNYNHKIDNYAFGTLLWEIFKREIPQQDPQEIGDPLLDNHISPIINSCRNFNAENRPDFQQIMQDLQN